MRDASRSRIAGFCISLLEFAVLTGIAPGPLNWVFPGVSPQLAFRRGKRVDLQDVGEARQVEQYVGDFIRHGAFAPRVKPHALPGSQPLKVFEQFTRFHDECGCQVLGSVALAAKPVQLLAELAQ